MKRLILFALSVVFVGVGVHAQTSMEEVTLDKSKLNVEKIHQFKKSNKAAISGWYNFPNEVTQFGGNSTGFFFYTFPDSNVIFEYTSGDMGPANYASVSQVFDPTSPLWAFDASPIHKADSFMLDSIRLYFRYFRDAQNPNPDTLRIAILGDADMDTGGVVGGPGFWAPLYDPPTVTSPTYVKIIDYLLENKDSSSTQTSLTLAVEEQYNPGDLAGAAVTFLPGYSWNAGDTARSSDPSWGRRLNRIEMFMLQDEDDIEDAAHYNGGAWATMTVHHENNGQGWNGRYIPGLAFQNGTLHFEMDFHITVDSTSVGIDNVDNGIDALDQNQPNPFSSFTTINYQLTSASKVRFEVRDVTGKLVKVLEEGNQISGAHSITIDATDMGSGVYYYTLFTETGAATRKMVVANN